MTAGEIRNMRDVLVKQSGGLCKTAEDEKNFFFGALVGMVLELTAQVAELNETMRGK